jgi:nitrite reductase (NO-forming)
LLVATLVLAACGSEEDEIEPTVTRIAVEGAPAPTEPGGEEATAAGAESPAAEGEQAATTEAGGEGDAVATTFDVEMVDIAFTQKELVVPANTEITINLVNNGVSTHNFVIDELGVNSGDYSPGQTGTVTFNTGAPGEYEYYCSIPGHREAGMVGKLIVVESTEGTTEEPADASPAAEASPPSEAAPNASPVASPAAPPAADAGGQTTFDVEMVDVAFSPTELVVPANTEITINLVNNGVAVHNFTIDELNVSSGDYAAGQTGTVTFNSGASGEYEYYCSIPGHKEAGMVGKLIVQ